MMVLSPQHITTLDTLRAAAPDAGGHAGGNGDLFTHLFEHAHDAHHVEIPWISGGKWVSIDLPHFAPVELGGVTIDFSITKHVVFLWVAALIVASVAIAAARKNRRSMVPSGLGNVIESLVVFIRDEVVLPNMGKPGLRYMPYLLTTFFFILVMNLLGLFPFGSTSTGNINVTAGLAAIAFLMIQVAAIRAQGFGHYLAHLTGGVHWSLWLIMIPIEILGLFTKPFALCIRLFANMTGGHLVIISLLGLIFLFESWTVAPVPAAFALGINMLELFVAVLQAYIFTMLTSLFMGLGIQAAHSEHEGEAPSH